MPIGPGRAGQAGMSLVVKPKDFSATMKKLIAYLKPFWIAIIFVIVFAVASALFAIVSPKILGNMTNQVVSDYMRIKAFDSGVAMPTRPEIDFGALWVFAIELLALYLLSAFFSYIQGWIMTDVSQKATYKLRRDISEKINRLPLAYFDKRTFGDVLSRVTNDVDTVSQTLNQSLTQIITSVTMIIGILIMMFTISWQMTIVSLVLVPLSFVLITVIVKKSQHYFKEQQNTLGELNGHIEEMYAGHNVMRVFNGEERSVLKFKNINARLYDSAWKSQFLSGLMMPIMMFVSNLGFVGVSVLGGFLAIKGVLRIGDIQAFIQYVNQFNQPIMQTANIANVLQSTAASAERVFEFLEEKEEPTEKDKLSAPKIIQGGVSFENVVFGYSQDKPIIKGLNAEIRPGQKIAIVGPTGAGKTTIVNLLMRFYEVNEGAIKIDGIDIREMKRGEIRKMFGMVLQDTWLFNGTIRENIAYGKPDATEDEIVAAARAAHADHFIHALPQGYDLVLNEEADNISQGEKQLLTIARAMLIKTPMLILDEATSSVDTRTEFLIQEAMENLMKGKTSFVIAHRLSTIRNADLILVMKDGNIVEQGNHEELLLKKGFYESLYNSQFAEVLDVS
ncbi:TPA: multidrug ABC transporter ATP-binding protein [Candidatus Falkowbacteria bacterium]|nr:multidrug ABC transporter ATP-binding protein [Candidatus Falkowbacteria bacterium]HAY12370.1 multidrug ABC transporter ATP-binding protein [Candidatus Falkowbacteria bacterium]HBI96628.1 multidrug ABC transporter ATP-binding protein [Candidatus Falkowbacteria bacterium]HBT27769.1 multidrug ABC transporter ATP-binding protein [Candidatus Falkowbacteria bacterium]HBY15146.1 multidrug ABC transporter ATP-binding protein [Candidatus Falkowbacteria bacterium]